MASPYAVDWARDWSITAGLLAVNFAIESAVAPTLTGVPSCRAPADASSPCAPQALWTGDRAALRFNHAGWRRSSDILQPAAIVLGAAATAALAAYDAHGAPAGEVRRAVFTDLTVTTQAVAAASFAATALKFAVRRPRPGLYRPDGRGGVQQVLSFPSGHTTAVAAASFAWAASVRARRPHAASGRWALGGAAALTSVAAAGRVLGGKHFPTDVFAGAALGAAVGVVVPSFHRVTLQLTPKQVGVAWAL